MTISRLMAVVSTSGIKRCRTTTTCKLTPKRPSLKTSIESLRFLYLYHHTRTTYVIHRHIGHSGKRETLQTPVFDATEREKSLKFLRYLSRNPRYDYFRFHSRYIYFRYKAVSDNDKTCKLMPLDRPSSAVCMYTLVISFLPISEPEAEPVPV